MELKENVVLEINPRTKEKTVKPLIDCILYEDYTVRDLINEHETLLIELAKLKELTIKLIDVVGNINKSMQVQIVDIKEEIK